MGQNNWRLAKNSIWKWVTLSLRGKNIIRNQIIVSKLWYIGQIYTFPKYQKGNWKKNIQEQEKVQPPRQWAQLSIWNGRLGILLLQTDTQLKPLSAIICQIFVFH